MTDKHIPAFPIPRHTRHFDDFRGAYIQDDGMTLRDYFAAKALQGIVNNSDAFWAGAAPLAYQYADAMLEARVNG